MSDIKLDNINGADIGPELLLVQCPVWGTGMPPMGLACLASSLNSRGVNLDVIDLNIEEFHRADEEGKKFWDVNNAHHWTREELFLKLCLKLNFDFPALAQRLVSCKPRVIAFSVTQASLFFTRELARELKRIASRIILAVGGMVGKDSGLNVDFIISGFGENSLFELVKNGTAAKQSLDADIENMVFPTYAEFDLNLYTQKELGVIFSRGCIGSCLFCSDKPSQGRVRLRNPHDVVNELEFHVKHNKIKKFWFLDLAVNCDLDSLGKLCNLIIARKLEISWGALAIPRGDMSYAFMVNMARAGCITLNVGIESGSDAVLRRMNKIRLFTASDASKFVRRAFLAGIDVQPNFIVGTPGETQAEFEETLEFIRNNKDFIAGVTNVNTCVVPQGSPIAENPDKFGIRTGSNGCVHPSEWKQDGLDYQLRLKRAEQMCALLDELSLGLSFSNLSETVNATDSVNDNGAKAGLCDKAVFDAALSQTPAEGFFARVLTAIKRCLVTGGLKLCLGDIASERLFSPLGAWQERTGVKSSSYGIVDNYGRLPGMQRVGAWRDFSGTAGVIFRNKEGFDPKTKWAVRIVLFDNSYMQGSSGSPVKLLLSPDAEGWQEAGVINLEGRNIWKEFSFSVPAAALGTRKIYLLIDDRQNAGAGFGKSIASIEIYKEG